jgi:hypothetical protein
LTYFSRNWAEIRYWLTTKKALRWQHIGRLNKKEVVLKKIFFEKLKEFNPNLPEQTYNQAYEQLTEESITKSLACSAMAFRKEGVAEWKV